MADQSRREDMPGACPVREVIRGFLTEGGLYDNLLADGDPANISSVIGLQALDIGYAHAKRLITDSSLVELFRKTNPDVLALEQALFLICQCHKALDEENADDGFARLYSSRVLKIALIQYLGGALHYSQSVYEKYYEPNNVKGYMDTGSATYLRSMELPSAALASRLLTIQGSRNFVQREPVSVSTRNQMLMGVYAMTALQKNVPAYKHELLKLLECFPGF